MKSRIRYDASFNYKEDFADMAQGIFSNDPQAWKLIKNYPKIRQKFNLLVDFYNKIDPSFNLEYFEKLSGQDLSE